MGFDGIKIGKVLHPMLTTMEQDSAEKGRRAVKELLSLIRGEEFLSPCEERKKGSEHICKNIRLPAKLFIGETVSKLE